MDDQRQKDQAQGMDEWQARLGWPSLRSALVFANERIKCMRHTEAVSNCEHCNFGYIVSWVQRQIDAPASSLSPGTTEGGNTWQGQKPIEVAAEIERQFAEAIGLRLEHYAAKDAKSVLRNVLRAVLGPLPTPPKETR